MASCLGSSIQVFGNLAIDPQAVVMVYAGANPSVMLETGAFVSIDRESAKALISHFSGDRPEASPAE